MLSIGKDAATLFDALNHASGLPMHLSSWKTISIWRICRTNLQKDKEQHNWKEILSLTSLVNVLKPLACRYE